MRHIPAGDETSRQVHNVDAVLFQQSLQIVNGRELCAALDPELKDADALTGRPVQFDRQFLFFYSTSRTISRWPSTVNRTSRPANRIPYTRAGSA